MTSGRYCIECENIITGHSAAIRCRSCAAKKRFRLNPQKRLEREKRNCLVCGNSFEVLSSSKRKVCSNSCRYVYKGIVNKSNGNIPPSRKGKPWPPGQYEKFREANSGEKNWNWKGGDLRWRPKDKKLTEWRRQIFEKDDYTCRECNKRGVYIEAHHIRGWKENQELRYDVGNGLTLCRSCHMKTSSWGQRGRGRNMEKCGALWRRVSKNGEEFYSGLVGGKSIIVFKNNRKNKQNQPDYEVFKGQDRESLPPKDEEEIPF